MSSVINNFKIFIGYGVLIFPLFLISGPLLAELFVLLTIIFSVYTNIREKKINFYNKYLIFFGLFYLSTLFSTLINYYSFDYSKSGIFYFRIPLFAFSIWLILRNFNLENKKILLFYNFSFLVIIIDSLVQYYFGQNLIGYEIIKGRISSFFGDELILGSFLLKILPIFLVVLVLNGKINNKQNNYIYIILISFISLIIYISGERTSFFLLIFFYIMLFIFLKSLRKFIILICALYFGLIIASSSLLKPKTNTADRMVIKTYKQLIGESRYGKEYKKKFLNKIYIFTHDHQGHYVLAFQIIKDHFTFGTGVRGFRFLCRSKVYILENNDGCSTHPHNTYIQIFTSNGIIGFTLLMIAYFYVTREMFKTKKKIDFENSFNKLKISKQIILVGIFVSFWPIAPSGNFFNNWMSMIYFYQIGFYLYLKHKNEKETY